ncbi:5-oxoprolinase subunit PxpA [Candidatus Bathyarchaeota archaeon]|nr:5-oxoprolinase subunit PxpA [Candidatus Bathyarchaeota archaeon]
MKFRVDINCDLGESYGAFKVGSDEKIMPHITSANIACGFHAGDPTAMMQTVKLAKKHDVAVGAHPGYPDLLGFGRREIQLTTEEIRNYTIYQISALQGFAKAAGVSLQHVKPHGALYNTAVKDANVSKAIAKAVKALNPELIIFAPPESALAKVAVKTGLRAAHEVFADRAYNSDGSLVSRKQPNAIIQEPKQVLERVAKMIKEKMVIAVNGETVNLGEVHTICVHGDTLTAVELVTTLKKGLIKAGIAVKPVSSFV